VEHQYLSPKLFAAAILALYVAIVALLVLDLVVLRGCWLFLWLSCRRRMKILFEQMGFDIRLCVDTP
jgi:hypothetical protein